jgi:Fe2+-dicitrate sensor, membrane component
MDSGRENLEYIDKLIEQQLLGQLSPEEELWIKQWASASPENELYFQETILLFKTLSVSTLRKRFEQRKNRAYRIFLSQIENEGSSIGASRQLLTRRAFAYAASILFAVGLSAISLYLYQQNSRLSASMQNIEIPYGSKSKVTLPDGTVVWLNSGSKLSYRSDFGEKNRNVILEGEGCFNVTKNPKMPFMVKSGKWQVKVLGTKFNFKSYDADANVKVTLIEGSLNISNMADVHSSVMLKPNQQVVIQKTTNKAIVKEVEAQTYAMWTEPKLEKVELSTPTQVTPNVTIRNTLLFDEEPLDQIFRELERAFNVKIIAKDASIKQMTFYGDFRNDESLADIMKIISMSSHLSVSTPDKNTILVEKDNKSSFSQE